MGKVLEYFRRWLARPKVRPWALAGPVLVLVIALPLLRPLRHPGSACDDETARWCVVRSIAERGTLSIDPSMSPPPGRITWSEGRAYSDQPPMMAVLLSGAYAVLLRCGLSFEKNATMVPYLLTLIGVTLPVAGAVGLIYRMARVFELRRRVRILLALGCVLGTGLISYSTVLNPHAPAAVLVLCGAGSILHVASSKRPQFSGGWLAVAGFCTSLAATIDPPAIVFLPLFALCTPAIRMRALFRIGGVVLFVVGASIPLLVHHALMRASGMDWVPLSVLSDLHPPGTPIVASDEGYESDDPERSLWLTIGRIVGRAWSGLLGDHGLLSHFPIILLGVVGVMLVMHRHWTGVNKLLAVSALVSSVAIVGLYTLSDADFRAGMFAARWFIPALPLLLFWAGAWLRHGHARAGWWVAGTALGFSVVMSLLGATNATPPGGFDSYTPLAAMMSNFQEQGGR